MFVSYDNLRRRVLWVKGKSNMDSSHLANVLDVVKTLKKWLEIVLFSYIKKLSLLHRSCYWRHDAVVGLYSVCLLTNFITKWIMYTNQWLTSVWLYSLLYPAAVSNESKYPHSDTLDASRRIACIIVVTGRFELYVQLMQRFFDSDICNNSTILT